MLEKYLVGGGLSKAGVTVCQINIELHGPLRKYGLVELERLWTGASELCRYHYNSEQFDKLMADIVEQSDFLPVTLTDPINHSRGLFLNSRNPDCLAKFVSPFLPQHLCA